MLVMKIPATDEPVLLNNRPQELIKTDSITLSEPRLMTFFQGNTYAIGINGYIKTGENYQNYHNQCQYLI